MPWPPAESRHTTQNQKHTGLPGTVGCKNLNLFLFFCFLFLIYLFIYLFLAALGLRCCTRVFSGCGERGLLFVAVCGLLLAVASLVAEHGL